MLVMIASVTNALAEGLRAGATLTYAERVRAAGYRSPKARWEFVAGHLLARVCVAEVVTAPVEEVDLGQRCAYCEGAHGRPYVLGYEASVSISHSNGMVAVSATTHPLGAGVDLEASGGAVHRISEPARRRVLSEGELEYLRRFADPNEEFLRIWVRKEALIKVGRADLDSMAQLDVRGEGVIIDGYQVFDFRGEAYVGAIASATTPTFRWLHSG